MSKKLIISGAICVLLGAFIGGLAIFLLTGRDPSPTLRESAIPGRYMIYGNEEISWGANEHRYDRIEGPGIYSVQKALAAGAAWKNRRGPE